MQRLMRIGFQPVGRWRLAGGRLDLELSAMTELPNVLYAFVCDDRVLYVGKTTKTLRRRMMGYLRPTATQATNLRNNRSIVDLLAQGKEIVVFAWPDLGLHQFGDFKINFAAALEDSIIETLVPPWNGGRAPKLAEAANEADPPDDSAEARMEAAAIEESTPAFSVEVGKTYHGNGFFNVPVACADLIGPDKALLTIYCGERREPIAAWVNRRAVASGTPRVIGGTPLREWFRAHCEIGDTVDVRALSESEITIVPRAHRA